jgi:branched-chain amino acid transport system permease protein
MVGALGLNLLVGETGQLSLGHSFFIASAYGTRLRVRVAAGAQHQSDGASADAGHRAGRRRAGRGAVQPHRRPPSGHLPGVASLELVFLGQRVLVNARPSPAVSAADVRRSLAGFTFDDVPGETLHVLGVPFTRMEALVRRSLRRRALWLFYRNLRSAGRVGRCTQCGTANRRLGDERACRGSGRRLPCPRCSPGSAASCWRSPSATSSPGRSACCWRSVPRHGRHRRRQLARRHPGRRIIRLVLPVVLQRYSGALPFVADSPSGARSGGVAARFCYGAAVAVRWSSLGPCRARPAARRRLVRRGSDRPSVPPGDSPPQRG